MDSIIKFSNRAKRNIRKRNKNKRKIMEFHNKKEKLINSQKRSLILVKIHGK